MSPLLALLTPFQHHTQIEPTSAPNSPRLWQAHTSSSQAGSFPSGASLSPPHAPANDLAKSRKISNVLSFFPIKDASGTAQLVVRRNQHNNAHLASLSHVPVESAVLIKGRVAERPEKDRRPVSPHPFPRFPSSPPPQSSAGDVEVHVDSYTVLNPADPVLPFYPSDEQTLVRLFPHAPPRTHPLAPTGQ